MNGNINIRKSNIHERIVLNHLETKRIDDKIDYIEKFFKDILTEYKSLSNAFISWIRKLLLI